jgi:hypothetical protein
MTETVGGALAARLHLVAVEFVLPEEPRVRDPVVLAEDLLASGFAGPATARRQRGQAPGPHRRETEAASLRRVRRRRCDAV